MCHWGFTIAILIKEGGLTLLSCLLWAACSSCCLSDITACFMSTVSSNSLLLSGHSHGSATCPRPTSHFYNFSHSEPFMSWHDFDCMTSFLQNFL